MERLQSGAAPLLASHRASELEAVARRDRVARASTARSGARQCDSASAPRPDAIFRDVQAGILKAVSVGARIHKLEQVKSGKGDELPVVRALEWEPFEVSVVAINGDSGAVFLADDARTHECFITGGSTMRLEESARAARSSWLEDVEETCPECDVNLEEAEAERDELVRAARSTRYATHFELGDVWAQKHIKAKTPADEAMADATRERASRQPQIDGRINISAEYDSPAFKLDAMAEGLAARGRAASSRARSGRGATTTCRSSSSAYEMLSWRAATIAGLDVRRHRGPHRRSSRSRPRTSRCCSRTRAQQDAPVELRAGAGARRIVLLARRQDLRDCKSIPACRWATSRFRSKWARRARSRMARCSENGRDFGPRDLRAHYAISRGRRSSTTTSAPSARPDAGRRPARARRSRTAIFFARCTSAAANIGPTLADAVQFFASAALADAAHANLASAGAAIDVTHAWRRPGRDAEADVASTASSSTCGRATCSTSPDKRTIAEQYTTQITPALPSSVNPFPGRLEVVSDANLPSANPWYLLADPARLPRPSTDTSRARRPAHRVERVGFEVEGRGSEVRDRLGVRVRRAARVPGGIRGRERTGPGASARARLSSAPRA